MKIQRCMLGFYGQFSKVRRLRRGACMYVIRINKRFILELKFSRDMREGRKSVYPRDFHRAGLILQNECNHKCKHRSNQLIWSLVNYSSVNHSKIARALSISNLYKLEKHRRMEEEATTSEHHLVNRMSLRRSLASRESNEMFAQMMSRRWIRER